MNICFSLFTGFSQVHGEEGQQPLIVEVSAVCVIDRVTIFSPTKGNHTTERNDP